MIRTMFQYSLPKESAEAPSDHNVHKSSSLKVHLSFNYYCESPPHYDLKGLKKCTTVENIKEDG